MKSLWIAQMQTQQGSVWMSTPWDGQGVLVVGHPGKWAIQKAREAQKFTARWMGEMKSSGPVFLTRPVELSGSWTALEPHTRIRLVPMEAKAAPQFESVSCDFGSIQAEHAESLWLKKRMRAGVGSLAVLILALAFWPKPKVEVPAEVIPPQMAKIILKKRPPSQSTLASAAGGGASSAASQNQKAPLSRALKSASFQKSISKLLSSQGFRQLSSVAPGQLPSLQKGGSLSGAPATGNANHQGSALPGVQVAALGNVGLGGGVGYGKGGSGNAAVGGQGNGQVLLDLDSSFVEEGLTRDEVGKVIHSHIAEVRYCYESSMIHKPDVEGRINVSFSIGADGRVAASSIHDSTVQDPRLDRCLLKRLNQWAFPRPKGGVTVAVTYPFIFKSLGR